MGCSDRSLQEDPGTSNPLENVICAVLGLRLWGALFVGCQLEG